MNRLIKVLLLAALFQTTPAPADTTGKALPKFQLNGLTGDAVTRAELKGSYTLMQFWASWCTSCSGVMVRLDRWTKNRSGVRLVPVSVDEDIASARHYFDKGSAALRRLKPSACFDADAKLATALAVEALPTVLLISPEGKVVRNLGGHPTDDELASVANLVGKGK